MLVHLRGTNGCGKSTAVRRLLVDHGGEVVEERAFMRGDRREPFKLWRCDGDLFVLGSYDLAAGTGNGGDRINGPFGVEVVRDFARRRPPLLLGRRGGAAG